MYFILYSGLDCLLLLQMHMTCKLLLIFEHARCVFWTIVAIFEVGFMFVISIVHYVLLINLFIPLNNIKYSDLK